MQKIDDLEKINKGGGLSRVLVESTQCCGREVGTAIKEGV